MKIEIEGAWPAERAMAALARHTTADGLIRAVAAREALSDGAGHGSVITRISVVYMGTTRTADFIEADELVDELCRTVPKTALSLLGDAEVKVATDGPDDEDGTLEIRLASPIPQALPLTFISGPYTGREDTAKARFAAAARALERAGYTPLNPIELCAPMATEDWSACMRETLRAMLVCERVALLEGWGQSRGCRIEALLAHRLGIPTTPIAELLSCGKMEARKDEPTTGLDDTKGTEPCP